MTEIERLEKENYRLKGEVADLMASIEKPSIKEEVLRLMVGNRDSIIDGMHGSSLCVRCEDTLAAESGFVRGR